MKVLLINAVCGTGSTGRICTDLAQQFEKEGHTVKIAYGRNGYVPEVFKKYAVRIGTDLDVKLHALQTRLFDAHGFGSKKATQKFLKWADEYNPDLVWLHNIHGYYINIELLFNWLKNRPHTPVKWTLHDCWAFTGHCSYFTMAKCDKWKEECVNCPQKKRYPASLLKDNSKANYERKKEAFCGVKNMTLITPSHWLKGLVEQSFLKEYPVEVVHNTIDTSVFKPTPSDFRERYHLQNKKIILGVASVWDERKGLKDFIKLASLLDERYQIVLVGLNKKQKIGLPKNILALPKTNTPTELAAIYTAADIFFNPTHEDNYPTVNLEAQACGTPIITYDVGGAKETIYTDSSKVVAESNIQQLLGFLRCPIRVLQVLGGVMNYGGIENYVMNYYRHINRSKVQFDFVVHGDGKGVYDDEILQLGGRIFHVPVKSHNPIKNWTKLTKICKSYPYKTIHVHMDAMNYIPLLIAKRCGIVRRISHSHNTNHLTNSKLKIWINNWTKTKISSVATHLFACSQAAGEWLYGTENRDKVQVISNAIDVKRFMYNPQKRLEIRRTLHLTENDLVVGHVGRFDYQKNHPFLLEVFKEIHKKNPKSKLICIGKGHTQLEIERQILAFGLTDSVFVLPPCPNVNEYYSAFDCFLFPSYFEGLGIVAVEAQCSGLPCFISDGVPLETAICNTTQIALKDSAKKWANTVLSKCVRKENRSGCVPLIREAGYDISLTAHNLEAVYL